MNQPPEGLAESAMSVTLPPEVFDLIVDHLHCEPTTLKACCLVSKSWVPRAQYHLFVDICFGSPISVQLWMKAFPDPSNSPAHHTRTLSILGPWDFTAVQLTVVRPWVHSFRHIVSLVATRFDGVSLNQLHGISPILKSLKLDIPSVSPLEIIDLICSFPLLENFWLRYGGFPTRNNPDEWNSPPTSPKLTGSLYLDGNICPVVRGMLDLPGGLHFAKISIHCYVKDAGITMDLVSKCSSTLGSLCVGYSLSSGFPSTYVVINTLPLRLDQGMLGRCLRLTSPRQQNSKTWSFGGVRRKSGGSLRRS